MPATQPPSQRPPRGRGAQGGGHQPPPTNPTQAWMTGVDQFGADTVAWMARTDGRLDFTDAQLDWQRDFNGLAVQWAEAVDEWGQTAETRFTTLFDRTEALRAHVNDNRQATTNLHRRLTVVERAAGIATRIPLWGYLIVTVAGCLAGLLWSAADFARDATITDAAGTVSHVTVSYQIAENPLSAIIVGLLVGIIALVFVPREVPPEPEPQNTGANPQAQPAAQQQPQNAQPAPTQPQPVAGL